MLKFSAGASANPLNNRKEKADNLFTAAIETELEFAEEPEQAPSIFEKIKGLFAKKEKTDDERFADQAKAIELLAEKAKETEEKLTELSADLAKRESEFAELKAENENILAQFAELEKQPAANYTPRPKVAGENAGNAGYIF